MKDVLWMCIFTLCLLLTLENSMMAEAGLVTKIKKKWNRFVEFKRCCIKKGCPFSFQIRDTVCALVRGDIKIDCKCERSPHKF